MNKRRRRFQLALRQAEAIMERTLELYPWAVGLEMVIAAPHSMGDDGQPLIDYTTRSFFGALVGGSVRAADGTAAAPTITFANQPNTGWYRAAPSQPALAVNGVERLALLADADTNYVLGDGTLGGRLAVYSQISALANTDLQLLGSSTTGDIHIGNLAGGTGVLFIDTNIKVAAWLNNVRGHGLQIIDGANNVMEEWPTAIATGIKYSAIISGPSWKLAADADAARFSGGGAAGALIIFPSQGAAGTGGNIQFQNNVIDGKIHFLVAASAIASVNYLQATGAVAASEPNLSAQGTDANISIGLIPKGTGVVDFTYAATALGGGAAPTLGTIGGTGPGTAAQNSWLKVNINGVASFIPVWR